MSNEHLSDSAVQQKAESEIVSALAEQLDVPGGLHPRRVATLGGTYVQLDACSDDDSILVEAYASGSCLKWSDGWPS